MGKFLIKIGNKLVALNQHLKGEWNSLLYKLMFKKEK